MGEYMEWLLKRARLDVIPMHLNGPDDFPALFLRLEYQFLPLVLIVLESELRDISIHIFILELFRPFVL